jgi:hypothetical protein
MPTISSRWPIYAAGAVLLFIVEIAIARFVPGGPIRSYGGDSLAVMLVYCGLMATTRFGPFSASLAALAIATGIEFGQAFDLLGRLGLEHDRLARIVLGSSFDLRDFLAYAVGGVLILMFESLADARRLSARRILG